MTSYASNHIKYLLATGGIDFSSDTFKIILMDSGFTFDIDDHETYSDVSGSELSNGNGYTTGGNTLSGVAVTEDDTDDRTEVTWNNTSWTASGGSIGPTPGAIIYDDTDGNDSIVGYIDFGGEQTQEDGGTATIANIEVRISQRMLKNFKQIYDNELSQYDSGFIKSILNHSEIRMFVYEICKHCVEEEIKNNGRHKHHSKRD